VESSQPALQESLRREHRLLRVRLAGWILIGSWQALMLLAEFAPIDLMSRGARVAGLAIGLVGTMMIAWGYARLMRLSHERLGESH
jgi:hypothetical protein